MVVVVRALVLTLLLLALQSGEVGAADCRFVLGFRALADQIPAVVGACVENEHASPANGDALQRTAGGLLVWRKADNLTAFTDGNRTWVNGPYGLQTRLNAETFDWEAAPGHTLFVFIPGYGGSAGDEFAAVKGSLAALGWTEDNFLTFGYAGGSMQGDRWVPNPYRCEDTAAGVGRATDLLEAMKAQVRRKDPRVRFVLVGHSLGGLVAWNDLARQPADLAGVVAVDAPLHGASGTKLALLVLGSCGALDSPTIRDLAALASGPAAADAHWRDVGAAAAQRGARAVTVGNDGDCFYFPGLPTCGFRLDARDERATQYVAGFDVRWTLGVRGLASHLAALQDPALARLLDGIGR